MNPGRRTLNEFEIAILEHIAKDFPAITPLIPKLNVLNREFTGVGSFTTFDCQDSLSELVERAIGHANISLPNVPNGIGAVLFCENGRPKVLETYTYGDEEWDGSFVGFSIEDAA